MYMKWREFIVYLSLERKSSSVCFQISEKERWASANFISLKIQGLNVLKIDTIPGHNKSASFNV